MAPPVGAPALAAAQATAVAAAEAEVQNLPRYGHLDRWEEADVQDLANNGIIFRFNNNIVAAPTNAELQLRAELRSRWHPLPVQ